MLDNAFTFKRYDIYPLPILKVYVSGHFTILSRKFYYFSNNNSLLPHNNSSLFLIPCAKPEKKSERRRTIRYT